MTMAKQDPNNLPTSHLAEPVINSAKRSNYEPKNPPREVRDFYYCMLEKIDSISDRES